MDAQRFILAYITALMMGGLTVTLGLTQGWYGSRLSFALLGIALSIGYLLGDRVLPRVMTLHDPGRFLLAMLSASLVASLTVGASLTQGWHTHRFAFLGYGIALIVGFLVGDRLLSRVVTLQAPGRFLIAMLGASFVASVTVATSLMQGWHTHRLAFLGYGIALSLGFLLGDRVLSRFVAELPSD